jgi:hypothetical protein
MHGGQRFHRGSRRRIARIRLRGNWPSPGIVLQMILGLIVMAALLLLHEWMEQTGRIS